MCVKIKIIDKNIETTDTIEKIIKDSDIENITDDSAIREVIVKIIEANPQGIADYRERPDRALKFFMGQVMKETKGRANPKTVNELIRGFLEG